MTIKTLTDIAGVHASGISCGIKSNGILDLGYIFVPNCAASAGVFTKNKWEAPSVTYTREILQSNTIRAVIVNSGNANAVTGEKGYQDVLQTASEAAALLGIPPREVAVASTGVIGKHLPMDNLLQGLNTLLREPLSSEGERFSRAIMTTDQFMKTAFREVMVDGLPVKFAATTKGCGMIAPNMATTLTFIVTDALVNSATLQNLLQAAIDETFNMTSVDTDTSTNDMCLIFSTGKVQVDWQSAPVQKNMVETLSATLKDLALQLVRDGEGATKIIEVTVSQSASRDEARAIARSIVDSPLVKTAMYGENPNWGRILAAMGKTANATFDPNKVTLKIGPVLIISEGCCRIENVQPLQNELKKDHIRVSVDLNSGSAQATALGCDLTHGYIDINTQYS